ncbi:helix-turn-helix transcriptional regulator [Flavobacterium sp. ANB]|uniref:AraC family transcriptional regulator n=1 Tax=unclassified Flavobacterium TaxID=196869 RepID=UPI00188CBD2B|nr:MULTISPECIES: helix-turn-helix transcriptional regulator [unclassified Flavobacterium]MBF4518755.1 helix-turn-helix transcriptional regulator [Flavobacterium sp. ANB]
MYKKMAANNDFEILRNIDANPKEVMAFNFKTPLDVFEKSYRHSHRKAQLLYVKNGVLNCEVDNAIWLVPAQNAVWIPSGLSHCVFGTGAVECVSIYFEPTKKVSLPENCCTLLVSRLLRELIMACSLFVITEKYSKQELNIINVLLDEICIAKVEKLYLPMPADAKLQDLVGFLINDPSNKQKMSQIAKQIGMSERNLARKLSEETGLSYGQWKRQLHIVTAIKKLSLGESVKSIAYELGYESSSSFVTMFKKVLGKPPLRYNIDSDK